MLNVYTVFLVLSIIIGVVTSASTSDILNDYNATVLFESNNIIPTKSTIIGTVPVYNGMYLSISMKINAFPADPNGANIFQVGYAVCEICGTDFKRYPGLYIGEDRGAATCLEFRMSNNNNPNNGHSYCNDITLNALYIIDIIYTESQWFIAINNTTIKDDRPFGPHNLSNNINVYASVPHFDSANVSIQHLLISKLQFVVPKQIPLTTLNQIPFNTSNQTPFTTLNQIPLTTVNQEHDNDNGIYQRYIVLACILGVVCFVFVGCVMILFYRKSKKSANECISNALVAVIAIGEYNNDDMEISNPDITDAYLSDLPVDVDLENIKQLFAKLNYKLMYKPTSRAKLGNESDCRWTEKEVVEFLSNDVGDELTNESGNYDGLIVFISCHGIENNIVTSDYRIIETTVLHRLISLNHTSTRNIPRLFVYDCCSGNSQREYIRASTVKINYDSFTKEYNISAIVEESNDMTKAVVLNELPNDSAWRYGTKNPDYKLAQVCASNAGFQAKCCTTKGSYLIYEFTRMLWHNIQNRSNQTLLTMFDKIQNTLHDSGKQQITTSFNNGTGYLQIVKNNKEHANKSYALNSQSEMQPICQ